MSKKRFTYMEQFNGFCDVYDHGRVLSCMKIMYVEKTVGLLNNLNDENKMLREENEQLKEKNQKNIQFVFDTIETYSDDCFHHNEGGWSYMLNDLIDDLKDGMGLKND